MSMIRPPPVPPSDRPGAAGTQGKLDGVAIRVPTPNVSVIDLKIVASRKPM